jgi:hypothetical protein
MTKTLTAVDGLKHGEVIEFFLPLLEGDWVISNMNSCSSAAEMLPADSFIGKETELKLIRDRKCN